MSRRWCSSGGALALIGAYDSSNVRATAYSKDLMILPERTSSNSCTGDALKVCRGAMDTKKVIPDALLSYHVPQHELAHSIPIHKPRKAQRTPPRPFYISRVPPSMYIALPQHLKLQSISRDHQGSILMDALPICVAVS